MRAKYVNIRCASASGVAERWRAVYCRNSVWSTTTIGNPEYIYSQLFSLGENPDVAEVARIIGNKSWSYITCDGCSSNVELAVEIGELGRSYCETCITEAAEVFAKAKKLSKPL